MGLEELIGAMRECAAETKPAILPEAAAIMSLREAAKDYAEQLQGPRFAVGSLVHPKPNCALTGHGSPHLVIETDRCASPDFDVGSPGANTLGRRLDTRLMTVRDEGDIYCCWVESHELLAWTGDGSI